MLQGELTSGESSLLLIFTMYIGQLYKEDCTVLQMYWPVAFPNTEERVMVTGSLHNTYISDICLSIIWHMCAVYLADLFVAHV